MRAGKEKEREREREREREALRTAGLTRSFERNASSARPITLHVAQARHSACAASEAVCLALTHAHTHRHIPQFVLLIVEVGVGDFSLHVKLV